MLSYTRDICTVSLHCEFYCAQQVHVMLQIVCYKLYIQMVSLLNDFVCVLLGSNDFHNICRILCTCIYLCEYSYGYADRPEMKTFSHTEYMNACFVHCVVLCEPSDSILLQTARDTLNTNTVLACHHVDFEWYQLQSLPQKKSLHIHIFTDVYVHKIKHNRT